MRGRPVGPRLAAVLVAALAFVGACTGAPGPTPTPTPGPTATPVLPSTPAPTSEPTEVPSEEPTEPPPLTEVPDPLPTEVVVTIHVVDEQFKVRLTQPEDILTAYELLLGESQANIPNGVIVQGDPDVNEPWSWHLDADDFEWAEFTTEVCDGKPSDVEANAITSDRFCPWSALVTAVEPVDGG